MTRFLRQLSVEIRRRRVLPVVVGYTVAAWLILQIAEVTFGPMGLPEWSIRVLIITAVAGFPGVIFLAWLIDIRPQGLIFDLPLWSGDSENQRPFKKSDLLAMVLLSAMLLVGTYALVISLLQQFPQPSGKSGDSVASALPANSIAVLAFDNFDGHVESNYFASGLAEEILNLLAGMRELNVAARTSSFRFRGEQFDIREIAKLLNVRHILEGSVRRDGNRIRVTAQLIDGAEGYHDWSKTYDRDLDDIFAIQEEIAAAVVNELKIALSVDSENRLQRTPTENIDAYIFYLQGRERLLSSPDADVATTARQLFMQALEIDPEFSRAYAGVCEANLRLYEINNDTDDFVLAEEACSQAESRDPGLNGEVLLALGRLYRYRGWYERAEENLNAAIAAMPTAVDAYIELGELRKAQNRWEEAEAAFLRAVDLKRNYWKAHEALASLYYNSERYSESARAYEVVTRLAPDVAAGFGGKGAAYWMLGEKEKAQIALDRSLQLKPTRQAYTNMGLFLYYAGQFEDAVKMQKKALEYAPDDHRVWGRLAETLRYTAQGVAEAAIAYQRAAQLARDNLEVNQADWSTRGLLGLYTARLGEVEEGLDLLELALEESGQSPEILYLQALVLLLGSNTEGALEALEEAVAVEPEYRQFVQTDPDLQALREQARFNALLPSAASKNVRLTPALAE